MGCLDEVSLRQSLPSTTIVAVYRHCCPGLRICWRGAAWRRRSSTSTSCWKRFDPAIPTGPSSRIGSEIFATGPTSPQRRLYNGALDQSALIESIKGEGQSKTVDLSAEARALAMLSMHPGWTDTKIAREVGVARTTLYDWPRYKNARALLKAGKNDRPGAEICQAVRRRRRLKPTPSPTLKNFILCARHAFRSLVADSSRHSPNGRGVACPKQRMTPARTRRSLGL